jgi:hypothetical protein
LLSAVELDDKSSDTNCSTSALFRPNETPQLFARVARVLVATLDDPSWLVMVDDVIDGDVRGIWYELVRLRLTEGDDISSLWESSGEEKSTRVITLSSVEEDADNN